MKSNFAFLQDKFPALAKYGEKAEEYCFDDSNSALIKLGMIGETIVNLIFEFDRLALSPGVENSHFERIKKLLYDGFITHDLSDAFHLLRKKRNDATHANYESVEDAKSLLQTAHGLCEWFMQTYGDKTYQNQPFVEPEPKAKPEKPEPVDRETEEALEEQLLLQALEEAAKSAPVDPVERKKLSKKAASLRTLSEAETRLLIDEQLRAAGWEADATKLRYSKGTRPEKGRNLAIAEWPTRSGRVDYALFVGLKMIATVEAKAMHLDVATVIDYQCKEYSSDLREEDAQYLLGEWGDYKVPFTFATNGRPYFEQFDVGSGVWFLDLRRVYNVPRALKAWPSPDGLLELLDMDVKEANDKLKSEPRDFLLDPDGLNLRDYQIRAIQAVEDAVIKGERKILVAMATGTGKTRTVLGMIYRFLKSGRFRRVLFLVDRSALGEQASDVFKEAKLEDFMTLDNIYDVKGLEDKEFEKTTRVQIATVQSMVKRILYPDETDRVPTVSDYDLVVVDEAHRGYILDREMGETETLYRDQEDFQSKYRRVLDYFDATKIALTATPALHTIEIFGEPVFQYSYREAVLDGWLVDHDAPHNIKTKLSVEGVHLKAGESVLVYHPQTGEMEPSLLPDELNFEVDAFNRKIVLENFNRAVLEEIAKDLEPDKPEEFGKTLIFAVDDAHADMIVAILKEIFANRQISNDAVVKFTHKTGDAKLRQEALRRFKNERFPSVAVTVDLLTTGVDVPSITKLVFMRRVKSRILFEQMLGRATRRCPQINKTHFEIYDPVGVYESLDDVNTMKPTVVNPKESFGDLLDGLRVLEDEKRITLQINLIIARARRKIPSMTLNEREHFESLADGRTPEQFVKDLRISPAKEGKEIALRCEEALEILERSGGGVGRVVIISDTPDEVVSHERGYGSETKPEDYLESFAKYVQENMDEIAALKIVCTRPKELTRKSLRDLRLALERAGYTVDQLNEATSRATNRQIVADLISFIRRYGIGATLLGHEERIQSAVKRLKEEHIFSSQEIKWIDRIEKYLLKETVLTLAVFDEDDRFKNDGGFAKINKIFNGMLESVVRKLNEYLYDDGGQAA